MGMSPSRMPQTQGMMGNHANNMVSQPANQGQFMSQGQFPATAGGAMNVNVGLGQPITQPAVSQVGICTVVHVHFFFLLLSLTYTVQVESIGMVNVLPFCSTASKL